MSEIIVPENSTKRKSVIVPGMVFGRLTAISKADNAGRRTRWLCECECGNQVTVNTDNLRNGHTQSCGCLRKERTSEANTTHGMRNTMEYLIWTNMKARCFNLKSKQFADYGGRGITVCNEWKYSFETFYADMGNCPEGRSLDRINNDGNYEPSNCKWSTKIEQMRNKRDNHLVTYKGETKTLAEWSEITSVNYFVLAHRINQLNWSVERALTEPVQQHTKAA